MATGALLAAEKKELLNMYMCVYAQHLHPYRGWSVFPAEQPFAVPRICRYVLPEVLEGRGAGWEVRDGFVSVIVMEEGGDL